MKNERDHDVNWLDGAVKPLRRSMGPLALALCLAAAASAPEAAGTDAKAEAGWPSPVHDETTYAKLQFDRLEFARGDDADSLVWDARFWYGGDYERWNLETEGEDIIDGGEGGEIEEFDLLYSRLFAPSWEWRGGAGYQCTYGPGRDRDRVSAVLGIQGSAPYWIETDAKLRWSAEGDASAELELEYEWLLTQRLKLQSRFETAYAFTEVKEFGVGQGLSAARFGLRLRYETKREIAPYMGVSRFRTLGDTADLAAGQGEDVDDTSVLAGVRWWY